MISSAGPRLPLPSPDPMIPTVFHNPWWLDAASGGDYQEVTIQSSGHTVARFPYVVRRRFLGQKVCSMPELTHYLGPALNLTGSGANRTMRNHQLTSELLSQVGSFASFSHTLHRGITEALAFESAGYKIGVLFTHEIAPRKEGEIWSTMRSKTRNVIRRASERWIVETCDDPDEFDRSYNNNLMQKELKNKYRRVSAICEAAIKRQQGKILQIRGKDRSILAAIFTVWDDVSSYYLMSTRSMQADNGAVSLLIWDAIQSAARSGLIFDFDGGQGGSRLLFTGFGGEIRPRFIASRHSSLYAASRFVGREFFRQHVNHYR